MRQYFFEITVHPSSENGTSQSNDNRQSSGSDLCKKWSGTSASNRPAKTENQSTIDLAFIECLGRILMRSYIQLT